MRILHSSCFRGGNLGVLRSPEGTLAHVTVRQVTGLINEKFNFYVDLDFLGWEYLTFAFSGGNLVGLLLPLNRQWSQPSKTIIPNIALCVKGGP